jgi:hypothetical protein
LQLTSYQAAAEKVKKKVEKKIRQGSMQQQRLNWKCWTEESQRERAIWGVYFARCGQSWFGGGGVVDIARCVGVFLEAFVDVRS